MADPVLRQGSTGFINRGLRPCWVPVHKQDTGLKAPWSVIQKILAGSVGVEKEMYGV